MDQDGFRAWLDRYFGAWASNDPAEVAALFAEDAVYYYASFVEPTRGRAAIVEEWTSAPAQHEVRWSHDVLAVLGDRGIAHWQESSLFDDRRRVELDGILVCDFDAEGRCTLHREWANRRESPS